jgi:predicted ArsR family transcriptional regulator
VQSTRARIVELLRGGGATVDDITNVLALAPATVRRHLDVLLRDGMVEMRSERLPLGRPHFVFSLSARGLETLPGHQFHLVSAVLDTILTLTPADTAERAGRELAVLVFDRLADQIVWQCRPAITARTLPRRLEQALEVLREAGLDFEASQAEEGYVIEGAGCPCRRLLDGATGCPHEASLLSSLVGLPVERRDVAGVSRSLVVKTGEQAGYL